MRHQAGRNTHREREREREARVVQSLFSCSLFNIGEAGLGGVALASPASALQQLLLSCCQ